MQKLQMKYHPAKKEVEFKRFSNDKEVPIKNDSRLRKYMNQRGTFILQDHGNVFLNDIAYVFDGERNIQIDVITTKNDFEDFEQMVEYYNDNGRCIINATLIAELPDMDKTYMQVEQHGIKSKALLEKCIKTFSTISTDNEHVKQLVKTFSEDLKKSIKDIDDKITAMKDNHVNLCFTGVYSAGKSALINSILGYAILPENMKSETAKMFIISSPKNDSPEGVSFTIMSEYANIIWDKRQSCFVFTSGPVESNSRASIQNIIESNKTAEKHIQLCNILKYLNDDPDIGTEIKIDFNIPIDESNVQFKIYDTPGTDSNYGEHQVVLKNAFAEQTHSILIFVATPNKLEGTGNNVLLDFLNDAESNNNKTSIDLGRSLFVINFADMKPTVLPSLKESVITNKGDEAKSIKLSDKKLFFTSAQYAYAAKAKLNNIMTDDDDFVFEQKLPGSLNGKYGRFYQHNSMGTSEISTKYMVDECNKAVESASDIAEKYYICSGVYALEKEIVKYGKKYASAVRAFAIIDSVDRALSKMNSTALSMINQNNEELAKTIGIIENLKEELNRDIDRVFKKYYVGTQLPDETLHKLGLDNAKSEEMTTNIEYNVKKEIKTTPFGKRIRVNDKNKNVLSDIVKNVVDDFIYAYKNKHYDTLSQIRRSFNAEVKDCIRSKGGISSTVKEYLCAITSPEIEKINEEEIKQLFDLKKFKKGILGREFIKQEDLLKSIKDYLDDQITVMQQACAYKYSTNLGKLLKETASEYVSNLEKYSITLKAKISDKEAMEDLRGKIEFSAMELKNCQQELNGVIWNAQLG